MRGAKSDNNKKKAEPEYLGLRYQFQQALSKLSQHETREIVNKNIIIAKRRIKIK